MKCKSCGVEARQLWSPEECGACFAKRVQPITTGPTIEALVNDGLLPPIDIKHRPSPDHSAADLQRGLYVQQFGRAIRPDSRPTPPNPAEEFVAVWLEEAQKWVVVFGDGVMLSESFSAIGYAVGAALDRLGLGEADFTVEEDTGSFYRYVRDREGGAA